LTKKDNWFDRLEKHNDEVRRSKKYRVTMMIAALIVASIMLAIVIAGLFVG